MNDKSVDFSISQIKTNILGDENFKILVNIGGGALVSNIEKLGSVLDIDVFKEIDLAKDSVVEEMKLAHNQQKRLFFNLIEDDYLKTLTPIYKKK